MPASRSLFAIASVLGIIAVSAALLHPHQEKLIAAQSSATTSGVNQSVTDRLVPADTLARGRISQHYGELPLSFEINQGQSDKQVKFLSRGQGYGLFLTPTETVLALHRAQPDLLRAGAQLITARGSKDLLTASAHDKTAPIPSAVIRMSLVGANTQPKVIGLDPLPGISNYYTGPDSQHWHTAVAHYAKVKCQNVYPGIDMVYYGTQNQLEYDLIVAPGYDPKVIKINFAGTDRLSLNAQGDLLLYTAQGEVSQHNPLIYQTIHGKRHTIPGRYMLKDNQQVSFEMSPYDTTEPLVIDPVLAYSTYLGGTGNDYGFAIAVDAPGNVYVTGMTTSTDFPAANPAQAANGSIVSGGFDVFVTKLNAAGSALLYSTYLGGTTNDYGNAIAVDNTGNAYVTGHVDYTNSSDVHFPTTPRAFQSASENPGGFVFKLSSAGVLEYSTYLSGAMGAGIAVDKAGNAYVTGSAFSKIFPITPGVFQNHLRGGSNSNTNAFVTKLNATGSALIYSTYLGRGSDAGNAIAVDSTGSAYITGGTNAKDFPTTVGAFQRVFSGESGNAFITKLNSKGTGLLYSTFLGAGYGAGIVLDSGGNIYVTGNADLSFPTTPGAFQQTSFVSNPLDRQPFVSKLNSTGSALIYSTFVSGGLVPQTTNLAYAYGSAIAVDSLGNAYITGTTSYPDFPTTGDALDRTCGSDGICNYDPLITPDNVPDAYFAVLNPAGSALIYSSFLGGENLEFGASISLDSSGNAYLTGWTGSVNFSILNAIQPHLKPVHPVDGYPASYASDVFITKFSTAPIVSSNATLLAFASASYSVNESQGQATIQVLRTGSAAGAVSVYYRAGNGTALARSDYTPVQGTLFWRNGDISPKFFTVPITRDTVTEPAETVNLQLVTAYGRASLGTPRNAALTIIDK